MIKIGDLPGELVQELYNRIKNLNDLEPAFLDQLEKKFKDFKYKKTFKNVKENLPEYDKSDIDDHIVEGIQQFIVYQSYSTRNLDFDSYVDNGFELFVLLYIFTPDWQKEHGLTDQEVEYISNHNEIMDIVLHSDVPSVVDYSFEDLIDELREEQKINPDWADGVEE